MVSNTTDTTPRKANYDALGPLLVYAFMLISFLPALLWLVQKTWQQSQLLNAFGVLVVAIVLVVMPHKGVRLNWSLRNLNWTPSARFTLLGAFGMLAAYYFVPNSPLLLFSLCLTLLSLGLYLFGDSHKRTIFSVGAVFFVFTLTPLLAPKLDWWLRGVAGTYSMNALALLGDKSQLGLHNGPEGPMLILVNEGRPFHVAPECNGFSLLTSSLLLSLLLALLRKDSKLDRLLIVLSSVVLALLANVARILVIIKLAPHVGNHYDVMHEAVGVFFFYLCLVAVWWLARKQSPATIANPV